jgi:hypothetical protein
MTAKVTQEPKSPTTDTPFGESDKLNRKVSADFLTHYLINKFTVSKKGGLYQSFVLNVNAEWGFGKTYLLQNWYEQLKAGGHPTVYFNAWESDYAEDPLVAFVSEIDRGLTPYFGATQKGHLKKVLGTAKKLFRPSLPFLLSVAAKRLTGLTVEELQAQRNDEASESSEGDDDSNATKKTAEDAVSTVVSKAAENALKEHKSRQRAIAEFKSNLGKLIDALDKDQKLKLPLFMFIDELDRCRPTYAIELLETIKHLFGVNGVYFVVATDSVQLSHSIKAVYGAEFAAERYLKRFFDQEYTLPQPDNYSFANHLLAKYGLANDPKLFVPLRSDDYPKEHLLAQLFAQFSTYFNLGLRDQEQSCAVLDGIRLTVSDTIHVGYALFLIMLRQMHRELFDAYARTPEYNTVRARLSVAVDAKAHLNVRERVRDWDFKPSSLSIDLLNAQYCNWANTPMPTISGAVVNNSAFEMIKTELIQGQHVPLARYVELVAQAGQLNGHAPK